MRVTEKKFDKFQTIKFVKWLGATGRSTEALLMKYSFSMYLHTTSIWSAHCDPIPTFDKVCCGKIIGTRY